MPRHSDEDRIFQLGDFWLSKQSRSQSWCRTWFDPESRQTRRVSLRTADLEEAKRRLTDWFVLEHTKVREAPSEASLAETFARYYTQKGSALRSADSVQRALRDWLDHYGEATVAEACEIQRQEKFHAYLREERGLGETTIRRTLTIGKAALNWAWQRGELASPPHVLLVKKGKSAPKGRPLSVSEVARLIGGAEYHLQAFIALMIATTGRTSAVLELQTQALDFEHDLIRLNPTDREQTNKYRPTIKLPSELKPWLQEVVRVSPTGTLIWFRGAPIASIRSAWRSLRTDLKLDDDVQPYSIRHTMARWLRKNSVPAWEVAAQLGHKEMGVSTTEIYAPFDPAYLQKSTEAINGFFCAVACELRVNSLAELLLRNLEKSN